LVSVFYVTIFTLASGAVAMLVGYVIAKKQFKGRKFVYFMLLSTMMVPGEVLLIPNYLLVRDLHLLNNLAALIVPGLVNIMGVFISKQFMESIPDSVLEAAKIDGAGEWRTFLRIAFPMAKSAFSTYVIITFTSTWNDYLWPMMVLNNYKIYPVQLAIQSFVSSNMGNNDYGNILKDAALISTLIPVLAIYFTFQKRFADGFAISGLK
jgi:ABC-type glycerol-3-phosphate transport system permease component